MRYISILILLCFCYPAVALEQQSLTNYKPRVTYEYSINTLEWQDTARGRIVPVMIYMPKADGPFPVILFSHGLGGSREHYSYLGQYWSSCGYVCVHLQHEGSDNKIWKNKKPVYAWKDMVAAANGINAINRVFDVHFAINTLTTLNNSESDYTGKFDLEKIGLAGHSFGAHTTLATIGEGMIPGMEITDKRIKAGIAMSSPVSGNDPKKQKQAYSGICVPCMHLTGTKDNSPIGETRPSHRRIPYDNIDKATQYLIIFDGADHMVFSGRKPILGNRKKDTMIQSYILEFTTAFWDTWLKSDKEAGKWLTTKLADELGKNGTFEMKSATGK